MKIEQIFEKSIAVKQQTLQDKALLQRIQEAVDVIVKCYQNGGKTLFCGNGGSAADAQHLSAEFSGRFYYDRDPLDSEALHVNTSYLTAVANDYSYDEVFARLTKGRGNKGDVFVGLSTSGNSENIIRAMKVAKEKGLIVIAFTGDTGGKMKDCADILLNVPSKDTPRVQEVHILIGHIICELVEATLFPQNTNSNSQFVI